jgi:predicted MPP superfamily phosphohydrolase
VHEVNDSDPVFAVFETCSKVHFDPGFQTERARTGAEPSTLDGLIHMNDMESRVSLSSNTELIAGRSATSTRSDILIVHLTDLHIDKPGHSALASAPAVAAAVRSLLECRTHILVMLSGDIAQAGTSEQYELATTLLAHMRDELAKRDVSSVQIFVSPGNHDCDYKLSNHAGRKALVAAAYVDDSATESLAEALQDVKAPFAAFRRTAMGDHVNESPIQARSRINLDDVGICVDLIDTAWASTLEDQVGQMELPISMLKDLPKDRITLALAHHPPSWFSPTARRNLIRWYDQHYDFVFTGHEHFAEDRASVDMSGRQPQGGARLIVGNAFTANEDVQHEGFKCIQLDQTNNLMRTSSFQLHNGVFRLLDQSDWVPRGTNSVRLKGTVRLRREFEEELENIGIHFTHPHVNRSLRLHDVFVFPNLRKAERKYSDFSRFGRDVESRDILSSIASEKIVLVVGPEQSGKTTLAKHLFGLIYDAGKAPLLLNGEDLRSTNRGEVTAWIKAAEASQYHDDCLESVRQLAPEERVAFLDNTHSLPAGEDGANQIVARLRRHFSTVVVFTTQNPALSIVALQVFPTTKDLYWRDSAVYEVMTLGSQRRAELIRKWVYLGRADRESEDKLEIEVRQTKEFLDSALGRHGFPKYPLFVLLLLQQLETLRESKGVISSGSQGYLFEALITDSLDAASLCSPISTVLSFLSLLARHLVDADLDFIDEREFQAFHRSYAERKSIQIDRDKLLRELVYIDILTDDSRGIGFRYRYNFNFFLARDMAARMAEEGTKDLVAHLISLIHTERSTNVLTFLAHFRQEVVVIEHLLARASETYANVDVCNLEKRTALLLRFRTSEQRLVLMDGTSKAITDVEHRKQEVAERRTEAQVELEGREGDPLGLNAALKLVQVLGQVLKSRAGDIDGDVKHRIAAACVGVAGRTMEYIYRILDQAADDVVRVTSDAFEEQLQTDKQKSVAIANSLFALVVTNIALVACTRAADALSSQELLPLLDELDARSTDKFDQLVLLGARLNVQGGFPGKRVAAFVETLPTAMQLAMSVVRRFVSRRLFYNPPDRAVKQSVCRLLEIELHPAAPHNR